MPKKMGPSSKFGTEKSFHPVTQIWELVSTQMWVTVFCFFGDLNLECDRTSLSDAEARVGAYKKSSLTKLGR